MAGARRRGARRRSSGRCFRRPPNSACRTDRRRRRGWRRHQLAEYFAGERRVFSLDLAPRGTEFQQRVWQALDSVPYGTTTTYGQLAARLDVPRDRIQALGAAIGANPLAIIRPCHRVIGSDGGMRGYAGGVERKQQLLAHEGALLGVPW